MNQSERYKGAIALIKSQTNYSEKEAVEKLEEWEGDYMKVMKSRYSILCRFVFF